MATPFFGKRDIDSAAVPLNSPRPTGQPTSSAYANSSAPGMSGSAAANPVKPYGSAPSASPSSSAPAPAAVEGGSKLTVGPNIKLKGVEITDCDTLVVEGMVEATMHSRVIQIAEQGAFKGSAEIDVAEIRGVFNGHLTVRQKLVIYATGKVTGTIRYGKLVVEEGGQLSGELLVGFDNAAAPQAKSSSTGRPELQAA